MRVNGEVYFLLNGWMDLLCLLLAARIAKAPVRMGRMIPAAALGAAYAVLAWMGGPGWRSPILCGLAGLIMAVLALGKAGFRAFPGLLAAGFLLAGLCRYAMERGAAPAPILLLLTCFTALMWYLPGWVGDGRGQWTLEISWKGRSAALPALCDSGNLLHDPVTGLPVLIAPRHALAGLLPDGFDPRDLATMPSGCRLIPIETAAGGKTLVCFRPDRIILRRGRKARPVPGLVAVSDFRESRALLPAALFRQEAEKYHART